jgi:Rod binding domain-containing protein
MDNAIQSAGDMAVAQAQTSAPSLARMGAGGNVDKAAQDFEAMFISQMLEPMFETIGTDPTFGGGHGEEIMRSFLVQEYGKIAAKGSHFGIAAMVKGEMIRAQANNNPASKAKGGSNANAQ